MLNLLGCALIAKTAGQSLQYMAALFNFAQQQATTVGTDLATIEFTHYNTATKAVKFQLLCGSLCFHKAVFPLALTYCSHKCYAMKNSLFLYYR